MEDDPIDPRIPSDEHAEYNPSSLSLFERCPGYLNRKDETNPIAERGTRIHKALEKDDLSGLDLEKERPVAQMMKDFVEGLLADMLPAKPEVDLREIKLHIDLGGGITTFGTCDRAFKFAKQLIVADYKSGFLEVDDAEVNAQAWAYVIGFFQRFADVEEIVFWFIIPNRNQVSTHTFTRADLPNMILRLNTIIMKAKAADPASFSPQQELCCYCARQAICPALASKVAALAGKIRPSIVLPKNPTVSIDRIDDIPKLLHLAPIVEAWAKEVRAEALRLTLEEGVAIKGFKRLERATPRAVNSVIGTYDAIKDVMSLEDFLLTCSKVSLPDLEDAYAAAAAKAPDAKRGVKKAARQDLENRLRAADVLKDAGSIFYLRESKK